MAGSLNHQMMSIRKFLYQIFNKIQSTTQFSLLSIHPSKIRLNLKCGSLHTVVILLSAARVVRFVRHVESELGGGKLECVV